MSCVGFKAARDGAIKALEAGNVQHAARDGEIDEKNFLAVGTVTATDVIKLLRACRGNQHTSSPHHQTPSIEVHLFKPEVAKIRWYIKLYFIEPDVWFISVHK